MRASRRCSRSELAVSWPVRRAGHPLVARRRDDGHPVASSLMAPWGWSSIRRTCRLSFNQLGAIARVARDRARHRRCRRAPHLAAPKSARSFAAAYIAAFDISQMLWLIPALVLAPSFVILMVCIWADAPTE